MRHLALNEPVLGDLELEASRRAIEGGFISTAGPLVAEFENAMAERLGVAHAIATVNGTSALHLAFLSLGVGAGDLIAVADMTFIASANAAAYTGADLLFVDSELDTWNIDGELLYDEIVRRSKMGRRLPTVIEPVHILGQPARWEPFRAINDEFGIPIVEDASEALGALVCVNEQTLDIGSLGTLSCLSFNGNKILTTGGGGMVLTDSAHLAGRIRHLATQAKVSPNDYEHDEIGFNYRMPALLASVGLAQLSRLDGFLAAKQRVRQWYEARLAAVPGINLSPTNDWSDPSHWLISARVDAAILIGLLEELNSSGIGARRLWRPMHLQRPFAGCEVLGGANAREVHRTGFSLPSSPDLAESDVDRVCGVLDGALRRLTRATAVAGSR